MYLPTTYQAALVMMLCGMFFWGAWPNSYKLTRNWRIELFYWDYSVGIFLWSIAIGLTLGSWFGPQTYLENLSHASRTSLLYSLAAGALWNVGNILLVLGLAMVGLAVAFPVSIGIALVAGVISSYLVMPKGNSTLLFGGVGLVFAAVLLNSAAHRAREKVAAAPTSRKGILVCVLSGLFFFGFGPLVGKALSVPAPLGPYGIATLFTLGALITTVPMMIYVMRHPVAGAALTLADYRAGTVRDHMAGLLGGLMWTLGTVFTFVPSGMVGIALAYAIGQANPLIAALFGVFIWREFRGAPRRAVYLLALMFLCYLAGLLSLACSFNIS